MPNDILLALQKSFKQVYDLGYTNEICNLATELYIRENRLKDQALWPLISPNCPVVNRIIAYRFEALLNHIIPVMTSRELAAKYIRDGLCANGITKSKNLTIYSLTPCPGEMISIREPILLHKSYLDGVLGLNEAFRLADKNLKNLDEKIVLHNSSGIGIGWGMSGGEISGLGPGRYLAVSGVAEIIRYLEKIEMGLLDDMEYVEFRACNEGCIGGPMSIVDRYKGKHVMQRLSRMFGIEKRLSFAQIQNAYKQGYFFSDKRRVIKSDTKKRLTVSEAIDRQMRIDEICQLLPGKECGICGSPDCRTFAEDIVDNKNTLENCLVMGKPAHASA